MIATYTLQLVISTFKDLRKPSRSCSLQTSVNFLWNTTTLSYLGKVLIVYSVGVYPPDGVIQLENLRKLFLTLAEEMSDTSLSLEGIQVSLISWPELLLMRESLRLPPHRPRQILCKANSPCCTWITALDQG